MSEEASWTPVCKISEILEDDLITTRVGERCIAVYRIEDDVFATDGLCTHEQADLGDGFLDGHVIECPKHNARFDVRTGKVLRRPAKDDLHSYRTKVVEETVFVQL